MKQILIICLILLTSACAFAPKKVTAIIDTQLSYRNSVSTLVTLVDSCWIKEGSWGSDAIRAEISDSDGNFMLTLGRDNTDISFMPFATIEVIDVNGFGVFSVKEGGTFLAQKWNLEQSINSWLKTPGTCES